MSASGSRVIDIQVGTPKPGFWCCRCNLPSMVCFPLVILQPSGVQSMGHLWRCLDHDPVAAE